MHLLEMDLIKYLKKNKIWRNLNTDWVFDVIDIIFNLLLVGNYVIVISAEWILVDNMSVVPALRE